MRNNATLSSVVWMMIAVAIAAASFCQPTTVVSPWFDAALIAYMVLAGSYIVFIVHEADKQDQKNQRAKKVEMRFPEAHGLREGDCITIDGRTKFTVIHVVSPSLLRAQLIEPE